MFGSKKNKNASSNNVAGGTAKTLALNTLVKGTVVDGNIQTESDIRIDGVLTGNLNCGAKVIIGPSGRVDGEINCQNAVIEGEVEGILLVAEILTLKETAIINGDASYDKLVVHQGAVINAAIRRNDSDSSNHSNNNSVKKVTEQEVEA